MAPADERRTGLWLLIPGVVTSAQAVFWLLTSDLHPFLPGVLLAGGLGTLIASVAMVVRGRRSDG